ncbi:MULTISPECIES: hypothetical protein [unclassified Acinetobacter]|uniref:hypothetical protein n=1 Tax=Acinetobacter TaxID=469 RepID=UPI0018AC658C|nr:MULTISPECIES: hypothetical protein [unclassified Acinetobacter]MBJ9953352.1 hypothetical protein [Acinetobacter baumannii]
MDLLKQISNRIAQLRSGEKWTLSIQDLFVSRADFQSISVFLCRESEKGQFSLKHTDQLTAGFDGTSLTIVKN